MEWVKVESKSRPGQFYYFNKTTKESKWKPPSNSNSKIQSLGKDEANKVKVTQNAAVPSSSQFLPLTQAVTSTTKAKVMCVGKTVPKQSTVDSASRSGSKSVTSVRSGVGSRIHLQANSNNCMETVYPDLTSVDDEEAMEIEERWADDDVIDMDVDMTEEQQLSLISEIHTTRNDLPLAASVDSVTGQTAPSLTSTKLYLVLDTNVLISHLGFLRELKDYAIKGVGRPVLVIPWIVMQELDALKTCSSSLLSHKARDAIRFLNDSFTAQHPRVRGQTMEEVHTELHNIAISNNDDRILHCCLLYLDKVKGHDGVVVLFSNDVQLCSKAMVNQVRALNRKTLLSDLRAMFKDPHNIPRGPSSWAPQVPVAPAAASKVSNRTAVEELLCEAESVVGVALSAAIQSEFLAAFGKPLWEDIVVIKPPWTFQDTVKLIDRHWIAVFRNPLPAGIQFSCVAGLLKHVKSRDRMVPTAGLVTEFLSKALTLLRAFANVSEYNGVLPHSIDQLIAVSGKLTTLKAQGTSSITPKRQVAAPARPSLLRTPSGGATPTTPTGPPVPLITKVLQPSCSDLLRLVGAVPPVPLDQLQWVLRIIGAISQQCCSRVFYTISNNPGSLSDKQEAAVFLSQLLDILKRTTDSINNVLVSQTTTHELIAEMLLSFESFLHTTLGVHSPVTMQGFTHCVQLYSSKVQQLLIEALACFSSRIGALEQLPRELGL